MLKSKCANLGLAPLPPNHLSLSLSRGTVKVEQGAWAALENLAGTNSAGRGTANTTSKAADAARELLCLIPYNDTGGSSRRVVDLLLCYMRCQPSRAGATSTLEMMEVCVCKSREKSARAGSTKALDSSVWCSLPATQA